LGNSASISSIDRDFLGQAKDVAVSVVSGVFILSYGLAKQHVAGGSKNIAVVVIPHFDGLVE
jgi:hypothetical protein